MESARPTYSSRPTYTKDTTRRNTAPSAAAAAAAARERLFLSVRTSLATTTTTTTAPWRQQYANAMEPLMTDPHVDIDTSTWRPCQSAHETDSVGLPRSNRMLGRHNRIAMVSGRDARQQQDMNRHCVRRDGNTTRGPMQRGATLPLPSRSLSTKGCSNTCRQPHSAPPRAVSHQGGLCGSSAMPAVGDDS